MNTIKQAIKALTVEEITNQIGQANTRYYALVSTLLYELRSRFKSDTLFSQHLNSNYSTMVWSIFIDSKSKID